ncbi:MAG: hypothetical protein ABI977_36565 [Acidobacteriota bacterium]
MNFNLADTHAVFWYLINSPLLGRNASQASDEADNSNALVYIPAIALAWLYYLNEKQGRLGKFHFPDNTSKSKPFHHKGSNGQRKQTGSTL